MRVRTTKKISGWFPQNTLMENQMDHTGSTPGVILTPGVDPKPKEKRISPSKSWCFTHNNYREEEVDQWIKIFEHFEMSYIIGREVGDSGTPHLQGYVGHHKIKFRPLEKFKKVQDILKMKPHWEKARGSEYENWEYCSKEKNYVTNMTYREQRDLPVITLHGWQVDMEEILLDDPDNRTIHWVWSRKGQCGKSSFVRYMVQKHRALVCAGKAADMKYQISRYIQSKKMFPEIIIFDVPRSMQDYLSYMGVEEIKNGVFASSKYESDMVVMPYPHVLVLANFPPDLNNKFMSKDRFKVLNVDVSGVPTDYPDLGLEEGDSLFG